MVLHHLLVDIAVALAVLRWLSKVSYLFNTVKWLQLKHTAKCIVFTCVYEGIGCGQHGSQTKINALLVRLVFSSIYISF